MRKVLGISRLWHVAAVIVAGAFVATALAQTSQPSQEPLLRIEAGAHTNTIHRISLSADGKLLATGSVDKTVRLWSLPDGRLIRTLRVPIGRQPYQGYVYAVAISPDGRLVAAGGWDAASGHGMFVYLFDAGTGDIVRRLGPSPKVINDLAFSHDGKRLAAGLGGDGLKVWDVLSGELVGADQTIGDWVYGVGFSSDGRLAVTSDDGYVRLYDSSLRLLSKVSTPSGSNPLSVAFNPDGKSLAVGYSDTAAVDVFDGHTLKTLFAADTTGIDNGNLTSVSWSADGKSLFAAGRYEVGQVSAVLRWSHGGQGKRDTLSVPLGTIFDLRPWGSSGIAFADDGPSFGLLDGDGNSVLLRGSPKADMRTKLGPHFLVSADARRVRFGLGYGEENPWLLDIATLEFDPSPTAPADLRQADTVSLSVTDWENTTDPKLSGRVLRLDSTNERSRCLAVLPDKNGFILGTDSRLRRYHADGKKVWEQPVPETTWGVNISADGSIIVAAYGDGTIRWHRASDGRGLLALFVLIPQDANAAKHWVLWTPKGYYAASPGGEDLLGWHINRGWDEAPNFFPATRFRDRFHRPDIVKLVLDVLDEERATIEANHRAGLQRAEEDVRK